MKKGPDSGLTPFSAPFNIQHSMARAFILLTLVHFFVTAAAIVIAEALFVQALPREPTGPLWELLNGRLLPVLIYPGAQIAQFLGEPGMVGQRELILVSTLSWSIAVYLPGVVLWRQCARLFSRRAKSAT